MKLAHDKQKNFKEFLCRPPLLCHQIFNSNHWMHDFVHRKFVQWLGNLHNTPTKSVQSLRFCNHVQMYNKMNMRYIYTIWTLVTYIQYEHLLQSTTLLYAVASCSAALVTIHHYIIRSCELFCSTCCNPPLYYTQLRAVLQHLLQSTTILYAVASCSATLVTIHHCIIRSCELFCNPF